MNTNSNNLQKKETIYLSHLDSCTREENFNSNWKFKLGDLSNAKEINYDDSAWENLNLPHDYSLTQDYTEEGEAESGYKLGGIGWYRKYFTVDDLENKRIFLDFDGVYMHATVFINGVELGTHFNGYTPFSFDLTEHLHDSENILAVRVNNPVPSSRWYSGSGIYRDVSMRIVDNIHVEQFGVNIKTPNLYEQVGKEVDVNIKTRINNTSAKDEIILLRQSINKKSTDDVLTSAEVQINLEANSTKEIEQVLIVNNPDLWSVKNPNLYEVETTLLIDERKIDSKRDHFGFRFINFANNHGFSLNGEAMKIQGVCMHHDNGSIGSVANRSAIIRKINILKDMGINAIRVAHNPASSAFLELADEMGVLVFDEAFDGWIDPKNGNRNDYSNFFNKEIDANNKIINLHSAKTWAEFDLKQMISRAINSPAVIAWSLGNEVMEGIAGNSKNYPEVLEKLIPWALEVDSSRPVTIGDNKFKENWDEALSFGEQLVKVNGVIGMNYTQKHQFDEFHTNHPEWKIIASETASAINSRGIYNPELYERLLTSYDTSTVGWGNVASDSWNMVVRRDFIAGEFVWTGFDYIGEPTPWNGVGPGSIGNWPAPKSSYFGIVDLAGIPKDTYYFYKSQWDKENTTLHILPAWDDKLLAQDKNGNVKVNVYSNAAAVELFVKALRREAISYGKKEFTKHSTEAGFTYQTYIEEGRDIDDHRNLYLEWSIPYQEGELYAVAYDENGVVIEETVGTSSSKTPNLAHKLSAQTETKTLRANAYDLAYIEIDILDESNELVRSADNRIEVTVDGEGKLLALDNGHQVDHEPYDSGSRKALSGKLVAVVQSTFKPGSITVNISSEGLEPTQLILESTAEQEMTEDTVLSYSIVRNYLVQSGEGVDLSNEVELELSNGDIVKEKLIWQEDIDTSQTGQFTLRGTVDNYNIPVHARLTVLSQESKVLNYSTLIPTGSKTASLPLTRAIVDGNGNILSSEVGIHWDEENPENYSTEGIVKVNGYGVLFGERIPLVANIRVADYHRELNGNVARNYQILTESTAEDLRSNNLYSLVQDHPVVGDFEVAGNNNIWTNIKTFEACQNTSEIIFTYATAQQIGASRLFFLDNEDVKPAEKVELFWALDANDLDNTKWEQLEITNVLEENISKLFEFAGVPAVGFKIKLTSDQPVGLSKLELILEELSLIENSDTYVEDFEQAIEDSRTSSNAAVTAISNDEETIVIVEAEDKSKVEIYRV